MPDEFLDRLSVSDRDASWRKALDAAGRILLVCRSGGQTVGFAACGPTRDQDKDASLVGKLYAIYVLPDFWGGGCGHALWKRVEKEIALAKFEELNVWVLDANTHARQFYEREGCRMDTNAGKDAHIGGIKLPEVRYSIDYHTLICISINQNRFPRSDALQFIGERRGIAPDNFKGSLESAVHRQRGPIFPDRMEELPFCRCRSPRHI